jgi:hypothetical protein
MEKTHLLPALLALLLAACGSNPTAETVPGSVNLPQTSTLTPSRTPLPTETPEQTLPPTETIIPINETSRYFEPGFQLDVEGNVDGIKVPFTVGLHPSIMNRAVEPVKSVTVNRPDTNDTYAKFWLTMCWKKYEMQHPEAAGMSFVQYEELVKKGGGEVQIAAVDEKTGDSNNKLLTFHPENGFVYIPVDYTVHLPEALNTLTGIYFGMNEKGQLVVVSNSLYPDVLSSMRSSASGAGYKPDFAVDLQFSRSIAETLEDILSLDNNGLLSSTQYWQKVGQGILPDSNLYLRPNINNPMLANKTPFFVIDQ